MDIDLIGMFKELHKYYKYWKDLKDEEIVIINDEKQNLESLENSHGNEQPLFVKQSYIIEGTIDDVLPLPPSFKLRDVKQYMRYREIGLLFGAGSPEIQDSDTIKDFKTQFRKVDERYISFSSIDNLELKTEYEKSDNEIKTK